ncbi:uncharacterized protein LOC109599161 [Aethina tumida]|uniref:uncharacterized protein LOC109599161 n=1 Tax=Aethina tumida TaxID=116153 RepID=UPI0021476EAA|nr:uncharacterized protein LOC109599161 [Aethina tumida]
MVRTIVQLQKKFNVALIGSAGGIGQPFSLLLKLDSLIDRLNLYDLVNAKGLAADLNHVETDVRAQGFEGKSELESSLESMDVVMIAAGVPRKPGMTRDDLFDVNASIVKEIAEAVVQVCPKALIGVITNPVNSTMPIVSEVFKRCDKYDPRRIFGVTTLDLVRANAMVGRAKHMDPRDISVPVIGGHSGKTIIPLISRTNVPLSFTNEEIIKLTEDIQNAGTEIVEAKDGMGSATLAMAYAAARFTNSLIKGLRGDADVMEYAFVASSISSAPYLSTRIILGKNGVEKIYPVGNLTPYEQDLLDNALPVIQQNIKDGIDFVKKSPKISEEKSN